VRTLIAQALKADSILQSLGVVPAAVLTGDVDTPQERPFINLKWGQSNAALRKTNTANNLVTIWVHDLPNDYSRIVAVLARVKVVLQAIEATQWTETSPWSTVDPNAVSSSGWVYDARWETESTDLVDEGHGTITRWAVYAIMSN
jgi:hypothetical protein